MILRHKAHEKTIGIVEMHDGLDFQYKAPAHANRLIAFVQSNLICRHKLSKQLVSHDEQNNNYKYKFANILELAPICRDDLVILPPKLSKALGGIGPVILVFKVTTSVHIVDVHTMQTHEIDSATYWKHMFKAVCSRERLQEYIVINIDNVDFNFETTRAAARQKFKMVQIEV
jgi:nonsense-mediated mRNA decay protein 3